MRTLTLVVDDDLDTALEAASAKQGRDKADIALELLRKSMEAERLKAALLDPSLVKLYEKLADEDVALAEAGMADYQKQLGEADRL